MYGIRFLFKGVCYGSVIALRGEWIDISFLESNEAGAILEISILPVPLLFLDFVLSLLLSRDEEVTQSLFFVANKYSTTRSIGKTNSTTTFCFLPSSCLNLIF